MSQLRTILTLVLPWRRYTIEGVLEIIAWVQRNYQRTRIERGDKSDDDALDGLTTMEIIFV